ncbi:hypothetical protein [Mycobacteroides chelonae]|uniref:hypothetical protein n=1 Tax=Mycobacteroides chelonae TaxID=1774 RepID=UPI001F21F547|nr:hypothetical protein [Mycobacteroides chelonae]
MPMTLGGCGTGGGPPTAPPAPPGGTTAAEGGTTGLAGTPAGGGAVNGTPPPAIAAGGTEPTFDGAAVTVCGPAGAADVDGAVAPVTGVKGIVEVGGGLNDCAAAADAADAVDGEDCENPCAAPERNCCAGFNPPAEPDPILDRPLPILPDEPMFGIDDPPLGIIDVNPPPEPKLDTGFEPPEGAEGSDVGNDDDDLPITSPEDATFPRVIDVSAVGAVAFSPVALPPRSDLLASSSFVDFEGAG